MSAVQMHMETNSDQMVGPEGISCGERGQVYSCHVEQSNPHGLSLTIKIPSQTQQLLS